MKSAASASANNIFFFLKRVSALSICRSLSFLFWLLSCTVATGDSSQSLTRKKTMLPILVPRVPSTVDYVCLWCVLGSPVVRYVDLYNSCSTAKPKGRSCVAQVSSENRFVVQPLIGSTLQ